MFSKKVHLFSILIVILFLVQIPLLAQDKATIIDQLMNKYYDYEIFNGTVLVAENSKVIYKNGFGWANMEWKILNKPDTKFRLGSITKQFTSILIMQLVEEGKIKLDGKLSDYVPDYPKEAGEKVTVFHLLNHTSGIPSYTGLPKFFEEKSRDPYSPDEFIKTFWEMDFEFEPGSKYRYNNSGYFLLGVIIEKVTGKPYEKVLQEKILEPLGLKDSGYDHHETILERRAAAYEKSPGGYVNAAYLDMSLPYAAGSLYSTVEDLYKWDQVLYTDKLISNQSKKKMFTPFLNNYAFGWTVRKIKVADGIDSISVIAHGGGINGFNTLITRLVDDKHLIVLLNNTGGTNLGEMSNNITNILYNQPFDLPKMPLSKVLSDAKSESELVNSINEYKKSKEKFAVNEREINNLGYQMLESGKLEEAIHIFKFNVDTYPKSANTYDSLGEAYLTKGEKEKAIQLYKKALEVNPRLESAKNMLKKLGEKVDANLGKEIKVPKEILQNYIGEYEIQPGFILTVTLEGEQLMSQATGQAKVAIYPMSKIRFFLKVVDAQIEFNVNEKGAPESLTLFQGGREIKAPKIK